jgi:hypothetical protein
LGQSSRRVNPLNNQCNQRFTFVIGFLSLTGNLSLKDATHDSGQNFEEEIELAQPYEQIDISPRWRPKWTLEDPSAFNLTTTVQRHLGCTPRGPADSSEADSVVSDHPKDSLLKDSRAI